MLSYRMHEQEFDSVGTTGHLDYKPSDEGMKASWQELREMFSDIDGSDIDLKKMRTERRAAKYESKSF